MQNMHIILTVAGDASGTGFIFSGAIGFIGYEGFIMNYLSWRKIIWGNIK
jgi:hypothetical protein